MMKACSRCGKIHPYNFNCRKGVDWKKYETDESKLRNTAAWHNKADEIRERSNYMCAVCYDEWKKDHTKRIEVEGLEVHHIIKVRYNPDLLLEDSNLICLCKRHHRLAESGELYQGYLARLALERDEG